MVSEPDTGLCDNEEAVPRGRHGGSVPVRTLGPKGGGFGGDPTLMGKGTSASEDTVLRRGVDCENPTLVGEENETPFIRVWKPLPNRRVLKTSREISKRKTQIQ